MKLPYTKYISTLTLLLLCNRCKKVDQQLIWNKVRHYWPLKSIYYLCTWKYWILMIIIQAFWNINKSKTMKVVLKIMALMKCNFTKNIAFQVAPYPFTYKIFDTVGSTKILSILESILLWSTFVVRFKIYANSYVK